MWRARRELQRPARGKALDLLASVYGVERARRFVVLKEGDRSLRARTIEVARG